MKLAFSTLGCPDWIWDVIFSSAKDIGMDGIEVRGVGKRIYAPDCRPFRAEHIDATIEKLRSSGMEIPVLDSGCVLARSDTAAQGELEAQEYIKLAAKLGTKYIRVMCVGVPEPCEADLKLCAQVYGRICEFGEPYGVMPLIETNGPLADSKVMKEFIESIDSENKGVLWDMHHPYRYCGESAQDTLGLIGKWIRHTHIKDSVIVDGKVEYRMLGRGDIPVKEMVYALRDMGYDGYISLEWVKRWNPNLEEAGVVFPNFANYMRRILA